MSVLLGAVCFPCALLTESRRNETCGHGGYCTDQQVTASVGQGSGGVNEEGYGVKRCGTV